MTSEIRQALETIHPISDVEWAIIGPLFHRKEYKTNDHLLRVGETERFLYFIGKGVVRSYIERNESEVTIEFSFEKTIFCSYASFVTQAPSRINTQALTDVAIWRITFDDLQKVYSTTSIGNLIGRIASEILYVEKSNRELALLSMSAEERYLNLFSEQPELIRNIPLKYIASYIGITPQALSRIRRRTN